MSLIGTYMNTPLHYEILVLQLGLLWMLLKRRQSRAPASVDLGLNDL